MPFKSEAQHRKFRAMLARGEISKAVFDKWMRSTKRKEGAKHPIKPLPERVKKASPAEMLARVQDEGYHNAVLKPRMRAYKRTGIAPLRDKALRAVEQASTAAVTKKPRKVVVTEPVRKRPERPTAMMKMQAESLADKRAACMADSKKKKKKIVAMYERHKRAAAMGNSLVPAVPAAPLPTMLPGAQQASTSMNPGATTMGTGAMASMQPLPQVSGFVNDKANPGSDFVTKSQPSPGRVGNVTGSDVTTSQSAEKKTDMMR